MRIKLISICYFLLLTNSGISQAVDNLERPKYTFEHIEKIKDDFFSFLLLEKASEIIFFSKWYIGSYSEAVLGKDAFKNHFEIYFFWKNKKGKSRFLKVDNFGEKKIKRKRFRKIHKFLKSNFKTMLQEAPLSPKIIELETEGKLIEIEVPFIDHELEYQIKIFFQKENLQFKYRPSWKSNKRNLEKNQYKFIHKLETTIN